MKNIMPLIERSDAQGFVRKLWRTAEFRKSHDNGSGFVRNIVESFTDTPGFFFELSDPDLETPHFSAWWGGIQLREDLYDNDAVHDLYYFHEMYHKGSMPYAKNLHFRSFVTKMQRNELEASVCSEIAVYFALPGLREKAFTHAIYADRFLQDPVYREAWLEDASRSNEKFRILRHSVMNSEKPLDPTEFWIRQYAQQNEAWASIWAHRYDEVECAMSDLELKSRCLGREQALLEHLDWLTSPAVSHGGEIPFPEQAKAFSGIYWLNKKEFQRALVRQEAGQTLVQAAAR